jgi:hypothetical protein
MLCITILLPAIHKFRNPANRSHNDRILTKSHTQRDRLCPRDARNPNTAPGVQPLLSGIPSPNVPLKAAISNAAAT